MTQPPRLSPAQLVLFAGIALALSIYSVASGSPESPHEPADLSRVVIELRERTAELEARLANLERCHPRLSNPEVVEAVQKIAEGHGVNVAPAAAERFATTLTFRVEMAGSKLSSMSKFRQELQRELLGTGRCVEISLDSVTITSPAGKLEVMTAKIEITRPPLR